MTTTAEKFFGVCIGYTLFFLEEFKERAATGFTWLFGHNTAKIIKAQVDGYTDIIYRANGETRRIRFPRKLGPSKYSRVTDSRGRNVTGIVETFIGPSRNFYGIPTTARMLGFETLSFYWRERGDMTTFRGDDLIVLQV